MTRRFPRLLAILLTIVAPTVLVAQTGKDMGPAGQFYQPPKTKFKFQPGPKKQGGEIQVTVAKGGHTVEEKNEYAINRYMYGETIQSKPSRYAGCGLARYGRGRVSGEIAREGFERPRTSDQGARAFGPGAQAIQSA